MEPDVLLTKAPTPITSLEGKTLFFTFLSMVRNSTRLHARYAVAFALWAIFHTLTHRANNGSVFFQNREQTKV